MVQKDWKKHLWKEYLQKLLGISPTIENAYIMPVIEKDLDIVKGALKQLCRIQNMVKLMA